MPVHETIELPKYKTPLPNNYKLTIKDAANTYICTIDNVIGHGGSCIVYSGTRDMNDVKQHIIIKECYPHDLAVNNLIQRNQDTMEIEIDEENIDIFKTRLDSFIEGQKNFINYANEYADAALPSVYCQGDANNTYYFVTGTFPGGDLLHLDRSRFSLTDAFEIIISLCEGLENIHREGKVYLDCKPGNVYTYNNHAYLFDFGTVQSHADIEKDSFSSYYSLGWSAPEQSQRELRWQIGYHTDIYAIGTTFYYLLTSRKPKSDDINSILENTFDWRNRIKLNDDTNALQVDTVINNINSFFQGVLQQDTDQRKEQYPDDITSITKLKEYLKDLYNCVKGAIQQQELAKLVEINNDALNTQTEAIKNIRNDALRSLYKNGKIDIPYGTSSIGDGVFEQNELIIEVTLPEGLQQIGKSSFCSCPNLERIVFPNTLIIIGETSFSNCTKLTDVTIPSNVNSIGKKAFFGCSNLATINITNGVEYIDDYAFAGCTNLKNIIIPSSVRYIGKNAFSDCKQLLTVNILEGIETIDEHAFTGCSKLKNIILPNSINRIGNNAFMGCNSLTEITIPDGMVFIGDQLQKPGIPYSDKSIGGCVFQDCNSLIKINLPNSIMDIGDNAFQGCSALKEIILPNKLNSIGKMAFSSCKSLESIDIPFGVNIIHTLAFANCDRLKTINLPTSVYEIGACVFAGCTSLKTVNLPSSIEKIGPLPFEECNSLSSIYYGDSEEKWLHISPNISLPPNVSVYFNT